MNQEISGEYSLKRSRCQSFIISVSCNVRCSTRHSTWTIAVSYYINDMSSTVSSTIGLFTDDVYIYKSIRNIDDCKIVQEDLDELIQWEQSWSVEFHPDKCKVLRSTIKRKVINYCYILHNAILKKVSNAKYLGETMNTRLLR